MPLFTKQAHELKSKFDKWCYFLKNLESLENIPQILNEPIFQKAFNTAELANLSPEQRNIYEENLIQYWGIKSALDTAVEEATDDLKIKIALKLFKRNLSDAEIAKDTGLSITQIEKLRANLHRKP
jgi:predicted transposase/invertase (TIGR01784 family)